MHESKRMIERYSNRREAGQTLAEALAASAPSKDTLVLALPRGGVPVAHEVAKRFGLPLDVLVVRKLGLPSNPELAMGALASGGAVIRNATVISACNIGDATFQRIVEREQQELERREQLYRKGRAALSVAERPVLLVDDGIATGSTTKSAVQALRELGAKTITVAVPVAPPDTILELRKSADHVLCLVSPRDFSAVGWFYEDFSRVQDEEVCRLLATAGSSWFAS